MTDQWGQPVTSTSTIWDKLSHHSFSCPVLDSQTLVIGTKLFYQRLYPFIWHVSLWDELTIGWPALCFTDKCRLQLILHRYERKLLTSDHYILLWASLISASSLYDMLMLKYCMNWESPKKLMFVHKNHRRGIIYSIQQFECSFLHTLNGGIKRSFKIEMDK